MQKEDIIEIRRTIVDVLPNSLFRVDMETGQQVPAHVSGKLRIHSVKIVKGDVVALESSPCDLTRGRIMRRLRHEAA